MLSKNLRGWSVLLCFPRLEPSCSVFFCISAFSSLKTNRATLGLLPGPSLADWFSTLLKILSFHLSLCHQRAIDEYGSWYAKKKKCKLILSRAKYPVIFVPRQHVCDIIWNKLLSFAKPLCARTALLREGLLKIHLLLGREESDGIFLSPNASYIRGGSKVHKRSPSGGFQIFLLAT